MRDHLAWIVHAVEDPALWFTLARFQVLAGEEESARASLGRAMELDPARVGEWMRRNPSW